jgi:dipeptidyl aminopeptidase/acylaminoacyl peptidase
MIRRHLFSRCEPIRWRMVAILGILVAASACQPTTTPQGAGTTAEPAATMPTPVSTSTTTPPATLPTRRENRGEIPVETGTPIDPAQLNGLVVFDDFEDLFVASIDGTGLRRITTEPGSEFDGAWSPDGEWLVYRDSRRGINNDDEIYVVRADGTEPRNLSASPANDWGPDWSADGEWIVFNSDRDGTPLSGYLVRPDGSDLHRIDTDVWFEYPSFSPDGSRVVFSGHAVGDYDIYVADLDTGGTTQLTDSPGADGWPVWSPDGEWIAFTTERDDCLRSPSDQDCWTGGEPGEHHDVWLMRPDGSEQHRVTPESGQFIAWAPDSKHLLISGRTLYVVRLDGTGRLEFWPEGLELPPGGIPDWLAESE